MKNEQSQKPQISMELESVPGISVIGFAENRSMHLLVGKGRMVSSDLFYAAWQNAENRSVSSRASSIRNGREVAGIFRLDSAVVIEENTREKIVRRLRQRETTIRTVVDLVEGSSFLTITIHDDRALLTLTLDDEQCDEVDQRFRQMARLLESYESADEYRRRIEDEAAERAATEQLRLITEKAEESGRAAAERLVAAGILQPTSAPAPTEAADASSTARAAE